MNKKLVYISGEPFWKTPDGTFENAVMEDGMPVENIIVRETITADNR
ncbi:hypothetical protein LJC40_03125 [Synergistaceae bacterium OttesenSCG-928-D05]|nr:hypothetical protein [Synergistaceae bacterium OttesenSCG-928-D05]